MFMMLMDLVSCIVLDVIVKAINEARTKGTITEELNRHLVKQENDTSKYFKQFIHKRHQQTRAIDKNYQVGQKIKLQRMFE